MLAPIDISFMLVCYVSGDPKQELGSKQWNSPAGQKTRDWLVGNDLVEAETYRATERGRAWVEFICQTPLPESDWRMPERQPKERARHEP